eukprot:TRINITY_DN10501_c0_g1_i2.p2 TRINITY_DN10501_c0_g1~~TRINITY_DN10501_c0_g1_i2.p2  ORF type:complete len:292 (+),score=42.32 TRINITY_DN10501_c0_g1_i2:68-877(+)
MVLASPGRCRGAPGCADSGSWRSLPPTPPHPSVAATPQSMLPLEASRSLGPAAGHGAALAPAAAKAPTPRQGSTAPRASTPPRRARDPASSPLPLSQASAASSNGSAPPWSGHSVRQRPPDPPPASALGGIEQRLLELRQWATATGVSRTAPGEQPTTRSPYLSPPRSSPLAPHRRSLQHRPPHARPAPSAAVVLVRHQRCIACGTSVSEFDNFCQSCGAALWPSDQPAASTWKHLLSAAQAPLHSPTRARSDAAWTAAAPCHCSMINV